MTLLACQTRLTFGSKKHLQIHRLGIRLCWPTEKPECL